MSKKFRTKIVAPKVQSQTPTFDTNIVEIFEVNPVFSLKTGGAPTGTAGDENVMLTEKNYFEYHIIGTQTIVAPVFSASGLNVGMDQTDNDGVEITHGITSRARPYFTVGTDSAFYFEVTFSIATVAGTDDCLVGFRKSEAYQGAVDDYDEMAALNVIAGDINIETILNDGATTTTDTTDNWADAESHRLRVNVSDAGVVTYQIDGSAPTTTAAFTFDSGEKVIPFFFLTQANAAQTGALNITKWEVGNIPG